MTAGRSLRTSLPTAGAKLTHQTSARFIGYVSNGRLGPVQRLGFARFLPRHLPVRDLQILANDVGPDEGLDELANSSPTDDRVQTVVDAFVHSDRQLFVHCQPPETRVSA